MASTFSINWVEHFCCDVKGLPRLEIRDSARVMDRTPKWGVLDDVEGPMRSRYSLISLQVWPWDVKMTLIFH